MFDPNADLTKVSRTKCPELIHCDAMSKGVMYLRFFLICNLHIGEYTKIEKPMTKTKRIRHRTGLTLFSALIPKFSSSFGQQSKFKTNSGLLTPIYATNIDKILEKSRKTWMKNLCLLVFFSLVSRFDSFVFWISKQRRNVSFGRCVPFSVFACVENCYTLLE